MCDLGESVKRDGGEAVLEWSDADLRRSAMTLLGVAAALRRRAGAAMRGAATRRMEAILPTNECLVESGIILVNCNYLFLFQRKKRFFENGLIILNA